jgi:hypothetical protein
VVLPSREHVGALLPPAAHNRPLEAFVHHVRLPCSVIAARPQTLVVKTYKAISRLRAAAKEANHAVPSMLSYTLISVRS